MPKLPDFTSLGERPTPQPSLGVASYEPPSWRTLGVAGYNVEAAGQNLAQAGQIIDATNDRYDKIAAEDAYNQFQAKAQDLSTDPQMGFKNVSGSQAMGQDFFKDYMGRLSDAQQQLSEGLANDRQKQYFQQRAQIGALQYRSALLQHQAGETERFASSTEDNTVQVELRNMAANPMDENIFQTGLARAQATIDARGSRLGLPPAQTEEMKGKINDAAWNTRITSIMNGVPGVMDANPYLAEKLFIDHQKDLGPAAQTTLGVQVLNGVKQVQQRDLAYSLVYGGRPPISPDNVAPATQGTPPLDGIIKNMESGGKRYDANGNILTSSAGAQGEMQVMPATAANPGFGVTPAKDNSPEELARVGKDYLGAMTARYQNPALILAAYNAGPGQVDKWIAQIGDPRSGGISPQDFAQKIPFAETRTYVEKGLHMINAAQGQPNAPISAPTANELKTQLPTLLSNARSAASAMYPNDPQFADSVVARAQNYANTIIGQQQANQQAANDMLIRGLVGNPDGTGKPQSIDNLLSDPRMRQAWDQATPETQLSIQQRLATPDKQLTQQGFNTYYSLLGEAGTNPENFAKRDLGQFFGQMPDNLLLNLSSTQKSINLKDVAQQQRDMSFNRMRNDVEPLLKSVGLGRSSKPNTEQAGDTNVFYGMLEDKMNQVHDATGKWPNTQDTQKIAAGLMSNVKVPSGLFGSFWPNTKPLYKAMQGGETPIQEGPATPKTPEDFAKLKTGDSYINPADNKVYRKN